MERQINIEPKDVIAFEVTGVLYNSRVRFKRVFETRGSYTNAKLMALGINLWNGSVWVRLANGKRKRINRTIN